LILEQIGLKENSDQDSLNHKFLNTNWFGYYRTRNPNTKRICIVKCCIEIDEKGLVAINNQQKTRNDGDFHNYSGHIAEYDNQLIFKLYEVGFNDFVYFIFSIPSTARYKELKVIYGVYVQTVPHSFATRVRSIVLEKADENFDSTEPSLIELATRNNHESFEFPFGKNYENSTERIRRLLFDRDHNYLATLSRNLSRDKVFIRKLKDWDTKFYLKSRPILIFI